MTDDTIKLHTIGFTRKSAEEFFGLLCRADVRKVIDIRLNNTSQLAGFAKRDDLRYFLKTICDIDYLHQVELKPKRKSSTVTKRATATGSDFTTISWI